MHTVQVGDSIPNHELRILENGAVKPIKTGDVFEGKKVVLFGLPGAFTSVCSSKHVPQYHQRYDELRAKGVDGMVCTSVNDPWVMHSWCEILQVDPNKILFLSDGDGSFHRSLGLTQILPACGERALRYSMFVHNRVVKILNIEEPGPTSYKISGPHHMLEDLERLEARKQEA
ncbi:thioredoxin-like protein [Cladochytrium replicatum]|nr:thioredoxin-like protein [Cladochytrium replicatum]